MSDTPKDGDPLTHLHDAARIIWGTMIWAACQPPPAHGAAFPDYHDWGNSDAEHKARDAAMRLIAMLAARGDA